MSLLFVAPDRNLSEWKKHIHRIDPNIEIDIWPAIQNKDRVQFAVCWNHPKHLLDSFPNIKAVSSLGAGVDHLLSDETLPESIDVARIVSPSLIQQMKEYILGAVISIQRNLPQYIRQSDQGKWQIHRHKLAGNLRIGIMGLGAMGQPVAEQLAQTGYQVAGWARSSKDLENIEYFSGPEELPLFLSNINILVCLLPLTDATKDILNLDIFKKLPSDAWVINAARGEHLVDEDLIYALDSNLLQGAWLDVFQDEPLPDKHAFWNRSNIIITPHIASITQPAEAAEQIVENYKRALSGMDLRNAVNREKGY
jgi:glyoxylate/hydroxypyruvate reductase A